MKYFQRIGFIVFWVVLFMPVRAAEPVYNLNVIYFLPKDIEPVEGYKERLTDLLNHTQEFYRKEMKRNGFGEKTFGWNGIQVIRGEKDASNYDYNGGGWRAQKEIEKFFREHPEPKRSHHALVIMPSTSGNDMKPGGVPFYGIGKYCFALDYKYFDIRYLGEDSPQGHLLTKWFGGMAHELGHGLNLPHNMQQVTEEKEYGTALMGAGNYTFGSKPTFLTKASCAILNNCEVFATTEVDFYKGNEGFKLEKMDITFTDKVIKISGKYTSQVAVNAVNVYVDPVPYGYVNNDYDAESWTEKTIKNKRFTLEIPRSELHKQKNDQFQVRVRFLFVNGNSYTEKGEFMWKNLKDYHILVK